MISSSRLAELQHVPPAWKFCAVRSQERFDRENAQKADRRKWKTTARPRKTLPGSPGRGHEKKTSAGGTEPGPPARTKRKRKCSEAPFMGLLPCVCNSRRLSSCLAALMGATSCGQHVGLQAHVVVLEGHERAHQSELGLEQQNRCRNSREIQRIEKKAFRARADAAQNARQEGTEPGTTRFRDGRTTTGPPAPRRGPGAPTAQPRPRGPDLESAQI